MSDGTKKTLGQARLMREASDHKFLKLSKWSSFMHKLKSIDMFGKPISFTYQYEETFQTLEGAIFTFLIFAALIIIGGIYLSNVVNKTE